MPGIEFVDAGPDAGADEDLAVGPRHRRPPSGRANRSVIAVLAVLVAAVAVGTVLRHGGDARPVAAASTPASSSSAPPAVPVVVLPTEAYTETITLPDCVPARRGRCSVDMTVPTDVVRAIQAHLGTVTDLRVASVLATGGATTVRGRTVSGQAGAVHVQVDVRRARAGQRTGSSTSYVGAFATVYATDVRNGLAVRVSVSGPQTQTPSVVSVTALAADRRLIATG